MLNAAIISAVEALAPRGLQQSWDNCGVQLGTLMDECRGVLLCVDVTPAIVDEAVERGCNLIISHHPLLFKGLKRISGNTPVEESVIRAIKHGITIYSAHTSLDSAVGGVSYRMAEMLGAKVERPLDPLSGRKMRIDVRVNPEDKLRALTAFSQVAPAVRPTIVNAETAAFETVDGDDPFGTAQVQSEAYVLLTADLEDESLVSDLSDELCQVLGKDNVTISITRLADASADQGLGVFAIFDKPLTPREFVELVKSTFNSPIARCTSLPDDPDAKISRIAICGGSGGEYIGTAMRGGAQAYLTSDVRYHDFVDYNHRILLVDIGHYESESCTKQIFYHVITEKFPNFACFISNKEENPINYI